jgi:diguanylate cyclase (GGDEF)-like protein
MQERLLAARVFTIVIGLVIAAVMIPNVGWPIVLVAIVMVASVLFGASNLESRKRPELWVFLTSAVLVQALVSVSVVLDGGPRTPLVAISAVPVVMVATRFSRRGLLVGAPASAVIVLATTIGTDPSYAVAHPDSVLVPFAVIICVALYMEPLLASDVRHRADSSLDQLTGLLNRRSLEPRIAEVSQQAAMTGQPVSFVAGDLDHFKAVNDQWGHAVGDLVLSQVARAMRRRLRTFELLYRTGGEEFLLVLPGANEEAAAAIAESLRVAVEQVEPGGVHVTCSFGVATMRGRKATLASLMQASDTALYAAKTRGRNQVASYEPGLVRAA